VEEDGEEGGMEKLVLLDNAPLTESRTRHIAKGDLFIMGVIYHDNVAHGSFVHKLPSPAEKSRSCTRNRHIHICWLVPLPHSSYITNISKV
jgi:hypothetical protein